jgi:hypothetical protein
VVARAHGRRICPARQTGGPGKPVGRGGFSPPRVSAA